MKNCPKPKFAQIILHMLTASRVETLAPTQLTQGCSSGGHQCAGLWFICEMPGAQLSHLLSPVLPFSSRYIQPEMGSALEASLRRCSTCHTHTETDCLVPLYLIPLHEVPEFSCHCAGRLLKTSPFNLKAHIDGELSPLAIRLIALTLENLHCISTLILTDFNFQSLGITSFPIKKPSNTSSPWAVISSGSL